MRIKCEIKISHVSRSWIPAIMIGTVQRTEKSPWCPGAGMDDIQINYTCDALVVLESFSKGMVVQLPFTQVKVTEEFSMKIVQQSVESSNIDSFHYNTETKELFVTFKGGRVYKYQGVPEKTIRSWQKAESYGKFFNSKIKPKYEGVRVDEGK
jgi:hypothetical protein